MRQALKALTVALVISFAERIPQVFGQPANPVGLIAELGCANCHGDLKLQNFLKDRTPDLSSAGVRYNPAYLFEFLRTPARVRQHLGRARMPNFGFDEKETLALVAFLETQRQNPGELRAQADAPPAAVSKSEFEAEVRSLACLTCHNFEGKGGNKGVELANLSYRLQAAWLKRFLISPAAFGVPPATMPPQFYQYSPDGKTFQEIAAQPARKIDRLTAYLFSLNSEKRNGLEQKYQTAKAAFPQATPALGEKIFRSQNCANCHRIDSIAGRTNAAPGLANEASRVTKQWLEGYLRHPTAVRPFGYHPGDGSRMPDFGLSDQEAAEISQSLLGAGSPSGPFATTVLSAFAKRKALSLVTEKLACLGCHRLGDAGGRIGPDLTNLRTRLQPGYVYRMIIDPRGADPNTVMPRLPLTSDTIELIANFLLQQDEPAQESKYLSLVENSLLPISETRSAKRHSYLVYCSACHGESGLGNGFNAKFLPKKPAIHADAQHMSRRPDDTLYDAISSGGYVVNKSHFMPPWGRSFSSAEIKGLVEYLRTLCRCHGPPWSLDNAAR